MNRHLHIVCLDVPWPADYGGAIDMLYKLEALHSAGIRIHLHYFSYNHRGNPTELNQYCESINIYERKNGWKGFSTNLPHIVASRVNEKLAANLNKDEHPVLLEGIHCTGIIAALNPDKKVVVRLHNNESDYYRQLGSVTSHFLKKIYYRREGRLLKKYEEALPQHCIYACITESDTATFIRKNGIKNTFYLPAFTPYREICGQEGMGNFCLYHGNLSVPENEKAALWLLKNVFSSIKIPLVIAGKNPSKRLEKLAHLYQHTCLVANPSESEISDLVKKAHINVLPSFNSAGIKIKLLHALFEGRHCVVNDRMINGTGLETACHTGMSAHAIASIITQLHHLPFTAEEIILRKKLLEITYNNTRNAQQLIQYLC